MNQRIFTTVLIFLIILAYWLLPLPMFQAGDHLLVFAQANTPVPEPNAYYLEQLSKRETEATNTKFWRRHRSYPHVDKAIRLIKEERFDEAIEVYDQYLEADPNHDIMRWYRLSLLSLTADSNKVIEASTDFLNRVPGFGPAIMIRAFAYHKINAYAAAEKNFESALDYKPLLAQDRKKALAQLYSLAHGQKNFDRSGEIAQQLLETYPDNALFREYYAQSLYQLGKFAESEKQWQEVQRLSKDKATVRRAALSRMTILVDAGQYASGYIVLRKLDENLFTNSDTPALSYLDYLRLKGTLTAKQGRTKAAKPVFEEALSFLSDSRSTMHDQKAVKLFQGIGDAAYDVDFMQIALKAYTQALDLGKDPGTRLKASEISWQLEDYSRTTELLHPLVFDTGASPPSIGPKIAQRLCMAYGRQGHDRKASTCFDKLMPAYARNEDFLTKAAHAAGRAGRIQHQIDLLQRCYDLNPLPDTALSIGYLYSEMEQHISANNWFQIAYLEAPTAETGMAYANGLLAGRNVDDAVNVIETVIQLDSLSNDQKENTYGTLADAYMRQDELDKAIDTWQKAHEVSSDMTWNISRVKALRKSGRLKMAEVLFSTIPVDLLSPEAQLAWYDEAGELYSEAGRFEESLEALRQAASMNSNFQRQLSLSMLLLEMDRLSAAEQSVNQALVHKPDDIVALRHKSYVLAAKGDNLGAVKYMEKTFKEMPEDYETLYSLGLLYMKIGRYSAATQAFRGAIDAIQQTGQSNSVIHSDRLEDLRYTQNHVVDLNRRFHYALSQSVNVGETDDRTYGVHLNDDGFTQAYGAFEVAYRPALFGYGSGRNNEIYSNLLWTLDDDSRSESEDDSTIQARLGFRSKPFASTNLVFAGESVFPLNGDEDPNLLVRMAHSFTRKIWQLGGEYNPRFGPNLYLHTYIELGKTFLNDAEYFGNLQTRIGRSFEMNGRFFLSPFAYFLGNGYRHDSDGDAHWQVGIGTAFDHFSGYDRYKGYRRHTEAVIRVGLDSDRDGQEREINGLVGLRFSFF